MGKGSTMFQDPRMYRSSETLYESVSSKNDYASERIRRPVKTGSSCLNVFLYQSFYPSPWFRFRGSKFKTETDRLGVKRLDILPLLLLWIGYLKYTLYLLNLVHIYNRWKILINIVPLEPVPISKVISRRRRPTMAISRLFLSSKFPECLEIGDGSENELRRVSRDREWRWGVL